MICGCAATTKRSNNKSTATTIFSMDVSRIISSLEEYGIAIVEINGSGNLFDRFREIDFKNAKVPIMDMLNRRVTKDELNERNSDKEKGNRESIFTSASHKTDYQELVNEFLDMVRPYYTAIINEIMGKTKHKYDISKFRESMGLHNYDSGKNGLHKHCDVDIISFLKSTDPTNSTNGPLMVDGDNVLVFSGALLQQMTLNDENVITPLVHWVGETQKSKFTIGAFIGPNSDEKLIQGENVFSDYTVGDFTREYFTKGTFIHNQYHY